MKDTFVDYNLCIFIHSGVHSLRNIPKVFAHVTWVIYYEIGKFLKGFSVTRVIVQSLSQSRYVL